MADKYTAPTIVIVAAIVGSFFVGGSSTHRYDDHEDYDPTEAASQAADIDYHAIGYRAAKRQHMTSGQSCGTLPAPLVDGCMRYVEEKAEAEASTSLARLGY